jgi:hypothetical protein
MVFSSTMAQGADRRRAPELRIEAARRGTRPRAGGRPLRLIDRGAGVVATGGGRSRERLVRIFARQDLRALDAGFFGRRVVGRPPLARAGAQPGRRRGLPAGQRRGRRPARADRRRLRPLRGDCAPSGGSSPCGRLLARRLLAARPAGRARAVSRCAARIPRIARPRTRCWARPAREAGGARAGRALRGAPARRAQRRPVHRHARAPRRAAPASSAARVLNTFAYTGALSVAARARAPAA